MTFIHKHSEMQDHTHETVAQAWTCTEEFDHAKWEAKSDLEAERRNERFFEDMYV